MPQVSISYTGSQTTTSKTINNLKIEKVNENTTKDVTDPGLGGNTLVQIDLGAIKEMVAFEGFLTTLTEKHQLEEASRNWYGDNGVITMAINYGSKGTETMYGVLKSKRVSYTEGEAQWRFILEFSRYLSP